MKIAIIVFGWAFLIWIALNNRDPSPRQADQAANTEGSAKHEFREEPAEDLRPPLPAKTVATITLIQKILMESDLNFHSLWTRHSDDLDLQTLILERWILQDSEAAMSAVEGSKLELLAWKLLGMAEGQELLGELNDLSENARNHALAGIAEKKPQAVVEVIQLQGEAPDPVILASILHGLAKEDILSALNYDTEWSSEWMGDEEFGTSSLFYDQQLALWAQTSPEKALQWLNENKERPKAPFSILTKNIEEAVPDLLDRFLKDLPTGRTKARLLNAQSWAKKETKNRASYFLKSLPAHKPETFLSLISAVGNAPMSQWNDWLEASHLEHLPISRQNLLRKIVIDRWVHHLPATFPERHYPDVKFESYAVRRWIEFDEESAIAQIEKFKKERSHFAKSIIEEAVLKTGKANAGRFFEICERYPEFTGRCYISSDSWNPPKYQPLLSKIARDDREGLLKHAQLCGDWGESIRMNLIYAWIEKDFEWVLARVQEWEMEEDFIWSEYDSFCKSPAFLDHFEKIPAHWRSHLVENNTILTGADLSWLKNPNPRIDRATLGKIFNSRQLHFPDLPYPVGDAETARELVVQSDILSQETKEFIVCHVLYDLDQISTKKAKAWLATLPPKYQQIGENWFARGLAQQLLAETRRQHHLEESRPDFLLAALGGDEGPVEWPLLTRPYLENKEVLDSAVANLSSEEAITILRLNEHQHLPRELQGLLVLKAVESNSNWAAYFGGAIIRKIAEDWGNWEPSTAAAWAVKIPHQRLSGNAVSVVYGEWRKYDREEAESWAKNLKDSHRKRLGFE